MVSLRKASRSLSPVTMALAGLCFLLPFVTVSCTTPGGFGRAAPGGTTTYTGVDLVVGARPSVSEPSRAAEPGVDDTLSPQPAAAVAFAVRVAPPRARRGAVAALAFVAATALLVNQALVVAEVRLQVAEHLTLYVQSGQQIPADKSSNAGEYVGTGQGFVLALLLLLVVAVANGIGWWRVRPRPALVAGPGVDDTQRTSP